MVKLHQPTHSVAVDVSQPITKKIKWLSSCYEYVHVCNVTHITRTAAWQKPSLHPTHFISLTTKDNTVKQKPLIKKPRDLFYRNFFFVLLLGFFFGVTDKIISMLHTPSTPVAEQSSSGSQRSCFHPIDPELDPESCDKCSSSW